MIKLDQARQIQLEYIGLREEDLQLLHQQRKHFQEITDIVVDQLYDNIYSQPALASIIDSHSTIDRLKETQRWYFMTLTTDTIDMEFIERRLYIGKLHSRIGLSTDWYLGTYMKYLDITVQNLKVIAPDCWMQIVLSLSKMFNFDSQLVLEAYEEAENQKIQELYEERKQTLDKVNQAVQDLVSMMVELSESSQTVAEAATQTANIQDKAYHRAELLQSRIHEIYDMGSLLQEVSDQTHLLGLNAAIEAAHAGEQGRGFGIVADEIRKLAAHSSNSVKTIKVTLTEISSVLQQFMEEFQNTSKLAHHQAASSEELSSFVTMIEQVTIELENIK